MQGEPRMEVVAQNDTDIDSSKGVDIDPNCAGTERGQHIMGAARITPADQHLSTR